MRDVKSKLGIWFVRMAVDQIPPISPEEAEITTPCSLPNGMCNATKPDWCQFLFIYLLLIPILGIHASRNP